MKFKLNIYIILTVIVLVIIIKGFVSVSKKDNPYKLSTEETLSDALTDKDYIIPEKLKDLLKTDVDKYRLIDLRNPYDFEKAHLENAINIPFKDLLSPHYTKILNQGEKINILYADNEHLPNQALLILKQLGYKNNCILGGGYDYLMQNEQNDTIRKYYFPDDKPLYDYAKITGETGKSDIPKETATESKEPVKIIKKERRTNKVAGGC